MQQASFKSPRRRPRRPANLLAIIAAVAAIPLFTAAAAQSVPTEDELMEVVITATPLRRVALETAQPVTVLGGDDLIVGRAASLGETLSSQPGLSSSSFGPIASRPIIRGQGGLRLQTLQDGADTLDVGALSDDHAVSIEPLLIDRIEVVRGPAALLFGSSAVAGAVNVLTSRLPLRRLEVPLEGALDMRGDTAAGERGVAARFAGHAGDALQLSADAHHYRARDLRIPGGRLQNSAGESSGGSLGIGATGENGAMAISVSRLANTFGLPGDEPIQLAARQDRIDLGAEWRPGDMLGEFFDVLRLRAARNDYAHSELEDGEVGTRYAQIGTEARISLERAGNSVIGLQWRDIDFDAEGDEAFLPPSRTRSIGAFAFMERRFGNLTFEGGARLERQSIDTRDTAARRYTDEALSGSAGLLWTLGRSWGAAVQVTSTQRHPTPTELFAAGPHLAVRRFELGNDGLGVETARTLDLSLRRSAGESGWELALGAFAADHDDFIIPMPDGNLEDDLPTVRFTAVEARFTGFEVELGNDALATSALGTFGLRLFADLVRARDAEGDPLPQIPPRRFGVELGLVRSNWRFGIDGIWHDAQRDVAPGERPTDGFTALSADFSYRLQTSRANILWFVRGANLLDEEMRRHASPLKDIAPLAARHFAAGMTIEF